MMIRNRAAVLAILATLAVTSANAQQIRRPTGRALAFLETSTPTPTVTPTPSVTPTTTPTPDACDDCPEPGGFICEMWPDVCYQCWEDCGHPIATHTPTHIPTPVATPTPTPNPDTANCSPEIHEVEACDLVVIGRERVRSKIYWLHRAAEGEPPYTAMTAWATFENTTIPIIVKRSCPVAAEWHIATEITPDPPDWVVVLICGTIPDMRSELIFEDGFETGDVSRWGVVVP